MSLVKLTIWLCWWILRSRGVLVKGLQLACGEDIASPRCCGACCDVVMLMADGFPKANCCISWMRNIWVWALPSVSMTGQVSPQNLLPCDYVFLSSHPPPGVCDRAYLPCLQLFGVWVTTVVWFPHCSKDRTPSNGVDNGHHL